METSDNEQPRSIQPATTGDDQDEYNFNEYDNEQNLQFANLGDVAVIDPSEQVQDDEDSEAEDDLIKPNDNLLIVGHVDEDAASLEVFGTSFCCKIFSTKKIKFQLPFQFTMREREVSMCTMTSCFRATRFASNGCITILKHVTLVIWLLSVAWTPLLPFGIWIYKTL